MNTMRRNHLPRLASQRVRPIRNDLRTPISIYIDSDSDVEVTPDAAVLHTAKARHTSDTNGKVVSDADGIRSSRRISHPRTPLARLDRNALEQSAPLPSVQSKRLKTTSHKLSKPNSVKSSFANLQSPDSVSKTMNTSNLSHSRPKRKRDRLSVRRANPDIARLLEPPSNLSTLSDETVTTNVSPGARTPYKRDTRKEKATEAAATHHDPHISDFNVPPHRCKETHDPRSTSANRASDIQGIEASFEADDEDVITPVHDMPPRSEKLWHGIENRIAPLWRPTNMAMEDEDIITPVFKLQNAPVERPSPNHGMIPSPEPPLQRPSIVSPRRFFASPFTSTPSSFSRPVPPLPAKAPNPASVQPPTAEPEVSELFPALSLPPSPSSPTPVGKGAVEVKPTETKADCNSNASEPILVSSIRKVVTRKALTPYSKKRLPKRPREALRKNVTIVDGDGDGDGKNLDQGRSVGVKRSTGRGKITTRRETSARNESKRGSDYAPSASWDDVDTSSVQVRKSMGRNLQDGFKLLREGAPQQANFALEEENGGKLRTVQTYSRRRRRVEQLASSEQVYLPSRRALGIRSSSPSSVERGADEGWDDAENLDGKGKANNDDETGDKGTGTGEDGKTVTDDLLKTFYVAQRQLWKEVDEISLEEAFD